MLIDDNSSINNSAYAGLLPRLSGQSLSLGLQLSESFLLRADEVIE
jgi:hypothetical protein